MAGTHDISTVTGEEIMLVTLAEAPDCRQPKKRQRQNQIWTRSRGPEPEIMESCFGCIPGHDTMPRIGVRL